LIAETKAVMTYLADFLKIIYDDILLTPTFNSQPIKADSVVNLSMNADHQRNKENYLKLNEDSRKIIEEVTANEYQRVLQDVVKF